MEKLISYGLCFALLFFSIKGSVESSLYEGNIKYAYKRMLYYFSILIAFISIVLNLSAIVKMILSYFSHNNIIFKIPISILKIITLICLFFIIHFIIYKLLQFLFGPFLKKCDFNISDSKTTLVLASSIFGVIKGFIVIAIMFIGVITYNSTLGQNLSLNIFNNMNSYNDMEQIVKIQSINVNYSDFKDVINSGNVLIYYNGVTLEEGIQSSEEIDNKARELANSSLSDIEKAKNIYAWVGSNIKYDFEKAKKALNNEDIGVSGAIAAWETRNGICFDYACLYVAMAREVGLKVRLITGEAFDGKQFGPHAWNEVYVSEDDRWINIDPTFYLSGNYFDNDDFYEDHIKDDIAGEW